MSLEDDAKGGLFEVVFKGDSLDGKTNYLDQPQPDGFDEILDMVFATGIKQAQAYRDGKGADTLTSDTLFKAKQALQQYVRAERRQIRKDVLAKVRAGLPEKQAMDAAISSGSHAGWGCTYGLNDCIDQVTDLLNKLEGEK